ncbi:MAG: DUF4835 family protein [bacterium]
MKIKSILSIALFAFTSLVAVAQELNCKVMINSSAIEGTNKSVYTTLESDLSNFMNTYRFTDLKYTDSEKIECTFMIIVSSATDAGLYTCEMQVQASRPVFGTAYSTPLINAYDQEFCFNYKEYDVIQINSSSYDSNITAVLAYYAYLIIGLDLDSYSRLGGTSMFKQAEQIVTLWQTRTDENESKGWKAFDKPRNRYGLISNITNDRFKPLREYYYEYHRLALDNMVTNVDNARAKIAEGITVLRDLNKIVPSAPFIITFLDAKNEELVNIFSKHGKDTEKESVYEILMAIYPTMSQKYADIKK